MTAKRVLPEGWQEVKFGEIAESITDRVDDPASSGLEYYVGLEHLDTETLRISRWGTPFDVGATKLQFRTGDVIYARRRAYQRKLGVAEWDGLCSAHALVLRARPSVCLPEFLPYFLQGDQFHERALRISVGSLSPTINWKTLSREEFVVPSLPYQAESVELLSAVDAVGEAYAVVAAEAKRVEQALSSEAQVSGRTVTLGELASNGGIQIGPFGSQLHAHEYVDDGVPVVMPSDMSADGLIPDSLRRITEATAQRLSQHRVKPGDILLPRRGDLDKRVLVSEREAGWLCGTGSVRVRLDDPRDAPLVERLLATDNTVRWLEANAVGTTMPNLNADIVSRIPLSMPDVEGRHVYADKLRSVREVAAAAQTSLLASRSARRSLLNRVLDGMC